MDEIKRCPICENHCDLSAPRCGRGRRYAEAGEVPQESQRGEGRERHGRPEGERERGERHGRSEGEREGRERHSRREFRPEERQEIYENAGVEEKILWNLNVANHAMHHMSDGKSSQKKILVMLKEAGTMTQRELTEKLQVQSASSSEILMKMEQAGWISRTPGEKDRRTMDIVLTPAGAQEAEAAAGKRNGSRGEMLGCLTNEEKDTLLALLEKMNAAWKEQHHGRRERGEGRGRHGRPEGEGEGRGRHHGRREETEE